MFIVSWCYFELKFFYRCINFLIELFTLSKTIKFNLLFRSFATLLVLLALISRKFLLFASFEIKYKFWHDVVLIKLRR